MLPKAILLSGIWCVLLLAYALLAGGGVNTPLIYYCLGVLTFFPILSLYMAVNSVRRWRVNDEITNWARVEELLSKPEQR